MLRSFTKLRSSVQFHFRIAFNDPSCGEYSVGAQAAPNILSVRSISRMPAFGPRTHAILIVTARCPPIPSRQNRDSLVEDDQIALVRLIVLDGKPIGAVYIRSDLQELRGRLQRYAIIAAIVLSSMSVAPY